MIARAAAQIAVELLADLLLGASRSEGYGGAEISSVCHQAALRAIRRAVHAADKTAGAPARVAIESADLAAAMEEAGLRAGKLT